MEIQDFVILRNGKEDSIHRFHPWVFSGAIFKKSFEDISQRWVKVLDSKKNILGTGYFSDTSIAVRLVSFEDVLPDALFWKSTFESALSFRKSIGLYPNPESNAFRLINGEGDGIPGLIVDVYADTVVLQFHHPFLFNERPLIIEGLTSLPAFSAVRVLVRNTFDKQSESLLVKGANELPVVIKENGIQFLVDTFGGQKTGFFLDQRLNRSLLETYAKGKSVLNTFCYTGGFSLYALRGGAEKVVSVDISAYAMEQLEKNILINGFQELHHEPVCTDVIAYMQEVGSDFDIIVLDPPAFAKSISKRHNAVQAYKRLNKSAIKVIKKGGLIFTFSCSQVVNRELFERTVYSAAIESGRSVRVLHRLTQSPCHPTSLFHTEGEYLKGLVLYIE